MAVFRVEKNTNFTVMSNHHLKNKKLSLKAKGLLSQILSLPTEWDYSLNGLAYINKEGKDSVREAIKELEREGYIVRKRIRDDKGLLGKAEYVIYEIPHLENTDFQPKSENPTLDNPTLENPTQKKPALENPTQLKKDKSNKKILNNDLLNIDSFPFSSIHNKKPKRTEMNEIMKNRDIVKDNIEYNILCERYRPDALDEIVDILTETLSIAKDTIRVSGTDFPAEFVKNKLLKLNAGHIEFVLDCMKENTTQVRNIRQYLLAALFNAPSTMDNYYSARVNHDLYG